MKGYIEDRLQASLKYDVINGDSSERRIFASQVQEAIAELRSLRQSIFDLHRNTCLPLPEPPVQAIPDKTEGRS